MVEIHVIEMIQENQYLFLFRDLEAIGWLKEKIFLGNLLNIHKNIIEFKNFH